MPWLVRSRFSTTGRSALLKSALSHAIDRPLSRAVIAAGLLGCVTLIMLPARDHLNVLNVSLIFLILVAVISLFADRWTSIGAAIAAFLVFDVFFVLPYYTVAVAASDHVLVLFVFLGLATLTSQLVYRIRSRTVAELARGRQMETLYELSYALIANVTLDAMLDAIIERVVRLFTLSACSIVLPDRDDEYVVQACFGPAPDLTSRDEVALIGWVHEHGQPAGVGVPPGRIVAPHGTAQGGTRTRQIPTRRSDAVLYIPITSVNQTIGVMRVVRPLETARFTGAEQQLLATFANHIALALERVRLVEEATQVAALARSDELKSALLAAVSHELRTPLASIKASATSLLQEDVCWSDEDRRDLLQAIDEETDRLSRIVSNLLDLSRIEAGVLRPAREWNDVEELVTETVNRARSVHGDRELQVQIDVSQPLPAIRFDYVQIAQVLVNLIENAAKYSPPDSTIAISVRDAAGAATVCVADRGSGIPVGEQTRVFDTFYRLERHPGIEGTGIGLSICRGIVLAHGGNIWVEQHDGGGSCFCFTLPGDAQAGSVRASGG